MYLFNFLLDLVACPMRKRVSASELVHFLVVVVNRFIIDDFVALSVDHLVFPSNERVNPVPALADVLAYTIVLSFSRFFGRFLHSSSSRVTGALLLGRLWLMLDFVEHVHVPIRIPARVVTVAILFTAAAFHQQNLILLLQLLILLARLMLAIQLAFGLHLGAFPRNVVDAADHDGLDLDLLLLFRSDTVKLLLPLLVLPLLVVTIFITVVVVALAILVEKLMALGGCISRGEKSLVSQF